MPLTAARMQINRASAERKMTMFCDIWRDINRVIDGDMTRLRDPEDYPEEAPGTLAAPQYRAYLENVPCYTFNFVRVTAGEFTYPERAREGSDWRMFVPWTTDVDEKDQIQNIRFPDELSEGGVNGEVMLPGPIGIQQVFEHSHYKLVMMAEVSG